MDLHVFCAQPRCEFCCDSAAIPGRSSGRAIDPQSGTRQPFSSGVRYPAVESRLASHQTLLTARFGNAHEPWAETGTVFGLQARERGVVARTRVDGSPARENSMQRLPTVTLWRLPRALPSAAARVINRLISVVRPRYLILVGLLG